jgi:putative heme-binding domain-containing protein
MKKAVLIVVIGVLFFAATFGLAKVRARRHNPGTNSATKEGGPQQGRTDVTPDNIAEHREKLRQAALRITGNPALISCLLRCARCHDLKGRKEIVGPPLADVADRLTREEIIEQILEPDKRAAKRGMIMVTFRNGRSEQLQLVKDSDDELQVRDGNGKIRAIPKEEIDECTPVGSSMPSGLGDGLTPQQFSDLVEFVMSRRPRK